MNESPCRYSPLSSLELALRVELFESLLLSPLDSSSRGLATLRLISSILSPVALCLLCRIILMLFDLGRGILQRKRAGDVTKVKLTGDKDVLGLCGMNRVCPHPRQVTLPRLIGKFVVLHHHLLQRPLQSGATYVRVAEVLSDLVMMMMGPDSLSGPFVHLRGRNETLIRELYGSGLDSVSLEDLQVLRLGLSEEDHRSAPATGTRSSSDAMDVLADLGGRIELDDEIDGW